MREIKISEDAYCDIEEIFSYVTKDNKAAAQSLRRKIHDKIKELRDFPFKYPMLQEEHAPGAERGYRYMHVSPYIVFYRVTDRGGIIIARVLHSRRNWMQALSDNADEYGED